MAYQVFLIKQFGRIGDERTHQYHKPMSLPIPPFIGLTICLTEYPDGAEIKDVWISQNGIVCCELDDDFWRVGNGNGDDVSEEDWPEQQAHQLQGWMPGRWDRLES